MISVIVTTVISTVGSVLISGILPMVFRAKEPDSQSSSYIVFKFNRIFKNVMLLCTIILAAFSLLFLGLTLYGKEEDRMLFIICAIVFSLLTLLGSLLYLLARNKRIIYEGNVLYVYNLFCREQIVYPREIARAIENNADGMKLLLKDNRKVKIDIQMDNYSKIKEILEKNNITYHDKHGNNAPKGW